MQLASEPQPPFTLDPRYADMTAASQLDLRTLYGDRDPDVRFGIGCAVLFLIPLALLALSQLSLLAAPLVQGLAFDERAVQIAATLTRCDSFYLFTTEIETEIIYTYEVAGQRYVGRASAADDRACTPPDNRLLMEYLPDMPALSRLIDPLFRPEGVPLLSLMTVGAALFLSVSIVWWIRRELAQARQLRGRYERLRRDGQIMAGEVVDIERKFVGRQREHIILLHYRFTTPDGRTLTGTQRKSRLDLRAQLPPVAGTPIRVLYAGDDAHVAL
ncbi:MAG: hypothetical protein SF123_22545 [Chloroflexota bacterium]|nr:hypothetical protein [Chloroflexota bacterium]